MKLVAQRVYAGRVPSYGAAFFARPSGERN